MPLHMACMVGHKSTAEILLSQGADVAARSDSGTPLDLASQSKSEALIDVIKGNGLLIIDWSTQLSPDSLNGVNAAKRMRTYTEIETIVKTFSAGKQTGQTRFLGDLQYLVVKHQSSYKILRLDLTEPISAWFPLLASKFAISEIDEYVLAINSAGYSSTTIFVLHSQHLIFVSLKPS